jgi:hypothetical protein
VKGRLDAIEARLDELQTELRTLVLRLPEPRGLSDGGWAEPPPIAPPPRDDTERLARPPIPPAPVTAPRRAPLPPVEPTWRPAPDPSQPPAPPRLRDRPPAERDADAEEDEAAEEPASPRRRPVIRPGRIGRTEPRLDWPR